MAKTINLSYNGVEYTLEYTRESVKTMEGRGFKLNELESKPTSAFLQLFEGAFLAHHRFTKPNLIEKIFDSLGGKRELLNALVDMYNEPLETLLEDPEDSEGNENWGKSW